MRCSRLISWVVQRQREIRPRTTFLWQEELKKHLAVLPENVFYLINTWAFRDILAGWLEQWDLNMYSFGDNQFIIKSLEFPDNLWFSDKMLIFHHNIIRRYIYIFFFFQLRTFHVVPIQNWWPCLSVSICFMASVSLSNRWCFIFLICHVQDMS